MSYHNFRANGSKTTKVPFTIGIEKDVTIEEAFCFDFWAVDFATACKAAQDILDTYDEEYLLTGVEMLEDE